MLLTREEAKKKWCPMANRAGGYGNADADGGSRSRCIHEDCMMWRQLNRRSSDGVTFHHWPHDSDGAERVGYCGLAGKPEGLK